VDLLATYNRSVRLALDTVSFGVGYRFGNDKIERVSRKLLAESFVTAAHFLHDA
jgi:hypothetical protein